MLDAKDRLLKQTIDNTIQDVARWANDIQSQSGCDRAEDLSIAEKWAKEASHD